MSRGCGAFSSSRNLTTLFLRPVRLIQFVSSSKKRLPLWVSRSSMCGTLSKPSSSLIEFMRHRWRNSGVEEEGYDAKTGTVVVRVDPQYFRPAEVEYVANSLPISFRSLMGCCNTGFSSETLQKPSACLTGNAKWPLTNSSARWSRPISKLLEASSRIKTNHLTALNRMCNS